MSYSILLVCITAEEAGTIAVMNERVDNDLFTYVPTNKEGLLAAQDSYHTPARPRPAHRDAL